VNRDELRASLAEFYEAHAQTREDRLGFHAERAEA
jgi:hypothetical protein